MDDGNSVKKKDFFVTESVKRAISSEQIQEILQWARWVPSGDNCQPWSFKINTNQALEPHLEIHYSFSRGKHALNRNEIASLLSFGCLLQIIEMTARSMGFSVVRELASDFYQTERWATLRFLGLASPLSEEESVALKKQIQFIPRRRTDRRLFKASPLSKDDHLMIKEMSEKAKERWGVALEIRNGFTPPFAKFVAEAESSVWPFKTAFVDFLHWVRFSKKDYNTTKDGMWWRHLGISFLESRALKLFQVFPFLFRWVWFLGFKKQLFINAQRGLKNSGGFCALTLSERSPEAVVHAGQLIFQAWLYLAHRGYGVQPLSFCSLNLFCSLWNPEASKVDDPFFEFYSQHLKLWREEFNLKDHEWPLWLFRFGWPKEGTEMMPTKRFELKEIVQIDSDEYLN